MELIKGVLFDYGNTLAYSECGWEEMEDCRVSSLTSVLVEQGLDLDSGVFKSRFREKRRQLRELSQQDLIERDLLQGLHNTLNDLGYTGIEGEVEKRAVEAFAASEKACLRSYPDAVETLDRLTEQGYRLGVISNVMTDGWVQHGIDRLGFRSRLDFVFTSPAVGILKPHPRIFQQALARWNFRPSQVVMIGDNLSADILGAQRAGMRGILATMDLKPESAEHAGRIVPDADVERLSDLPEVIAKL